MEFKDWLLLIIPIVLNGFVVFLVQNYINMRNEKRREKDALKRDVLNEFYHLVDQTLEKLHFLIKSACDSNKDLSQLLDDYNDLVIKLFECKSFNSNILKDYDSLLSNLFEQTNKFIDMVKASFVDKLNYDAKKAGAILNSSRDLLIEIRQKRYQ